MPENPHSAFSDLLPGSVAEIARRLKVPYNTAQLRLLKNDDDAWEIARAVTDEFRARLHRLDQTLGDSRTPTEDAPDVH